MPTFGLQSPKSRGSPSRGKGGTPREALCDNTAHCSSPRVTPEVHHTASRRRASNISAVQKDSNHRVFVQFAQQTVVGCQLLLIVVKLLSFLMLRHRLFCSARRPQTKKGCPGSSQEFRVCPEGPRNPREAVPAKAFQGEGHHAQNVSIRRMKSCR